jgi:hypothetical protein
VPTPEVSPTPRLGFTTSHIGSEHVRDQSIDYPFCPPTSGDHYNAAGRGPIRADVYPRTEQVSPGGWVHNLEHGYIVVLYRNTTEDPITDAEFQQLESFWDQAPQLGAAGCPRKVLVARFDEMTTPFAVLAWGRALLLDEWNVDTANTFVQQWTNHVAVPEPQLC